MEEKFTGVSPNVHTVQMATKAQICLFDCVSISVMGETFRAGKYLCIYL